ncbi:uncharacterized protein MONBRDRAFT_23645 [Monosiga brevicollis MX1]|uniref:Tc1-like transposase DDE domain-containing protein n=1 Tax=Monosiga brevicollis TaxID=81824 RepID=A9UU21_MONBE|nr:uncharacterized protein MONBRDRAFT_23645 [Monosiga brevicollis MX1]EDQ91345.1 predicted protein [Monosiga brevicollis MX1]|eukprot:XP_001743767.1 hypothetical protein [Monosiga brevicollis MX1]
MGVQNAIIVMDNARYHKSLPASTPRQSQKKDDLVAACRQLGLDVGGSQTKQAIWAQVEPWIRANILPVTVSKAVAAGHEVLFSPPHYSDLQPIELIWAQVKGRVGRTYHTKRTFSQVKEALQASFRDLSNDDVAACIDHSWKKVEELNHMLQRMADAEGAESDSDSDDVSDSEAEEGFPPGHATEQSDGTQVSDDASASDVGDE